MDLLTVLVYAIAAQVPDVVTNQGVTSWGHGGFEAAATVLAVVATAEAWVIYRLQVAMSAASKALLDFATGATKSITDSTAADREQTAALNALAQEVRASNVAR